jgi:hypothetical protein
MAAMFDDLLVDIIGEKSIDPANEAAISPVMALPPGTRRHPSAMFRNIGSMMARRLLPEGMMGDIR